MRSKSAAKAAVCMEEDSEGSYWVGTDAGLAQLRPLSARAYTKADGLVDENVVAVCEAGDGTDADGALWLATEKGLARLRDGRFFAFASSNGLTEVAINSILVDSFDYLWLGGFRGIHRASRSQLNAVADGRASAAQFLTFDTADGMESPGTPRDNTQPQAWKAHDGRLWFATERGVVVIDPEELQRRQSALAYPAARGHRAG